jgi:hypothetical protein
MNRQAAYPGVSVALYARAGNDGALHMTTERHRTRAASSSNVCRQQLSGSFSRFLMGKPISVGINAARALFRVGLRIIARPVDTCRAQSHNRVRANRCLEGC